MNQKFRIRLETMVQVVLVTSLLIITFVGGFQIYHSLQQVILDGFGKKLFAVSTTCAAFIDGDEHQQILRQPDENGHMYLQYVLPMRRILSPRGADFTYVYSQIVGPTADKKKDITYILDAMDPSNPEHSHIGDTDALPTDERVGGHEVQDGHSAYYISDMLPWAEWGLLKSCFVPIYDAAGHVVGMVGADVNVTIVLTKTNKVLAQVGFASIICMLVGAIMAINTARRLTRPMALVKDGALSVAAGRYGSKIEVHQPRELAELAESFNKLSDALASTVEELGNANRQLERRRRTQDLRRVLADCCLPTTVSSPTVGIPSGLSSSEASSRASTLTPGPSPSSARSSLGRGVSSERGKTGIGDDEAVSTAGERAGGGSRSLAAARAGGLGSVKSPSGYVPVLPDNASASSAPLSRDRPGKRATDGADRILIWLCDSSPDGRLEASKMRAEIAETAKRLARVARTPEQIADLPSTLRAHFAGVVRAAVLLEASDRPSAVASVDRPTPALLIEPDGAVRRVDLQAQPSVTLAPGQMLLVASVDVSQSDALADISTPEDTSARQAATDINAFAIVSRVSAALLHLEDEEIVAVVQA